LGCQTRRALAFRGRGKYIPRLDFPRQPELEKSVSIRRGEDRKEKKEFQTFSKPKLKITRTSASGKVYIDYKDTESLRRMMSGNGKIQNRKRTGATAMEQRMLATAIKRARYMSLLPYVTTAG
jgi:small subunit ribosomal protein S18